ncbi:MAG: cadmium-translocating P-type ATPase [Clostridiales bacterium]|nr:cadmium-translocating P-type ATPase [Clostridiales bacterium]
MIKKFSIGGMSCSACSSGIERHVSKLNGVNSVSVSLIGKEMTVDFDEKVIIIENIIENVEKLGYTAVEYGKANADKKFDANKMKKRFFISLFILLPLIYLCMGGMINLPVPNRQINFPIQFCLALAILIINKKFFINGVKAVINKSPNMDTLVSLGSASAFIYSVVMTIFMYFGKEVTHTFFDSSAMVVTLVTLGKWLEELSKIKTGDAIEKLGNLLPKTATVVKEGEYITVLTSELKIGDIIVLKAGEYVAVDGVVVEGNAGVDKSAITGESMPVEIGVGDNITSGSIVKEGHLLVRAEKVGGDTLFSKIVEIVKTAGASKAPIQKFADKVSGIFVPTVTALAIITFVVWILISKDLYTAFNFGISVLVVSCPCALGLATPVAVMAGTGKSAKHGILFKNAEALQNSCKISCVLLDKTATITVGKPKVTDYVNFTGESDQTIFPIISALEQKSSHPLADCVVEHCGVTDKTVENYQYVLGRGIIGEVDGVKYYIGNKELIPFEIEKGLIPDSFEGKTVLYFADEIQLVSVLALSDYVKEDSREAIEKLNSYGIKTVMITGDNYSVAKRIADQVGIDEFEAEVLPEDKYQIVEKYKKAGYFTAMVGDGINDSPALKASDVGIAMGTGTDIAIDSAEVVVANGSLTAIPKTIEISKKSFKIIKENLFWAFFYNVLGIPLAGGALSVLGVVLTPAIASAMMCISSLFVVTNALRISREGKDKGHKKASDEFTLTIEGMMCMHCVSKVKEALEAISGVLDVKVDLKTKSATLKGISSVTEQSLIDAIKNVGFTVTDIKRTKI